MTDGKPHLELVQNTIATVEEAHPPAPRWPFVVSALVVALTASAIVWRQLQADPIARMPPAQRYALYGKTLEHFAEVCEAAPALAEVSPLCADEADLLRRFPECDQACLDRTESDVHEHPTR